MQNLPKSGPIVIIDLDGRRCDALALLDGLDKPILISLPNFSYAKGNKYRSDLDSQLRTRHLRSRALEEFASADCAASGRAIKSGPAGHGAGTVHQVLRGLWEDIVKPILDALGFSRVDTGSGDVPPKLWWCPTGPLSFLPLHAAGIYGGSSPETVLDYVISSYTPTITAITNIVNGSRSIDPGVSGLFLTSHPNPSNASVIPGTTKEVRSIFANAEKSGIKVLKIEGDELTVDECLEHMQQFSCIHLACHGSQNAAEPLKSRFLLHQGSLELGTILRSNLKNADLAFLSACQTSTGEEKLPDEAVHLAAGMLAAGYRRVVGTMWSISDRAAQDVSVAYYEYLLARQKGGDNPTFDGTHSAHALYHATQQLRDRLDDSEDSLLTWIPFVHFGY
ncbi:hypothetical protein D9611_005496 [Ephemerocybe angulata]|uniref:CHAT domain-containing protein n=1 Tax=Ephemerocybe angulata TaxID=980116 RepID=A0A8H5C0B8_9AGAR|nr:hypothetical protein D9611_005496 [Tulosesus angulatus]